ncbi:MAG: PD40 domain-containing protein [Pyrinomonadaceae bacterium]|nr:PD40 domain-containing protein [Pyrinomonadaceae bacterium]
MGDEIRTIYQFGECRFDPKTGELWRNDEVTSLSSKASNLLGLLLENNGEFVSKETIFERVWPDAFVEDGVLTQNIYTLRKAIGNDLNGRPVIENKPKLGYRIAAPIEVLDPVGSSDSPRPTNSKTVGYRLFIGVGAGLILLVTAAVVVYSLFLSESVVTVSRLEKVRIQKITDTADITFPTISPDGNLVAYSRNSNIFVKDLNTSAETTVNITDVRRFGFMQFSNDGGSLYLRNRASYFLPADILMVSRFGGEAKKIAENVWSNGFSFSPDEKQVAFTRSFPTENRHALILKDLATNSETELLSVNAPEEIRIRSFPAYSSDGAKIAVIIDRQNQRFDRIVIYDVRDKTSESLTFKNLIQIEQFRWFPKMNTLLASAREGKFFQLWEISVADKKLSRITNDLNNYLSLTLSADGKKLLTTQNNFYTNLWMFEGKEIDSEKQLTFGISNRDGYSGIAALPNGEIIYTSNESETGVVDLFRLDPVSGKRQQLTRNAGEFNRNPAVSSDGTLIYFESNRSGRSAIWQINDNGDDPKQVTSAEKANDYFPQLSPDGLSLYFVRKTGKSSAVFRRSISDGQEVQLTESDKFSPANFLSLSPDGRLLGFQNLTENIRSDDPKQVHQIAIIDTGNPQIITSFNIGGRLPQIYWTADSSAFDYVIPVNEVDEIRRQSLTAGSQPQVVKTFAKDRIYQITHSTPERTLMARGRLQNDAVLITNFE